MAYNETLANRIREKLASLTSIVEQRMMGGLMFMYNDKMCVGVVNDELMCRIDKTFHTEAIRKPGCRTMDFTNRPMIGYVLINASALQTSKDLDYWIDLSLAYNPYAKASKRKKK